MESDATVRRLTTGDLERMAVAGVFGLDERVELIDGVLFEMTIPTRAHTAMASRLARVLQLRLPQLIVRSGLPLELGPYERVQPDIAVVADREDYYRFGDVEPRDVHLVVEVAEGSLGFDSGRKADRYGLAAIGEYWIVDVAAHALHVRRNAGPDGRFVEQRRVFPGDSIALLDFADVTFTVHELLGPSP